MQCPVKCRPKCLGLCLPLFRAINVRFGSHQCNIAAFRRESSERIRLESGDRTERIFDASRERVWRAFTDPEQLAQWWGRGNKVVVERMDVERGGHWRYVE